MTKASRSGISVMQKDVPVILAMCARGDRKHDIAAWFGLNQGRIAEVENGDYGTPPTASDEELPPSGSPGLKAKDLRITLKNVQKYLQDGNIEKAQQILQTGLTKFDKNE